MLHGGASGRAQAVVFAGAVLLVASMAVGCAGLDPDLHRRRAAEASRLQLERERTLSSTWVGRTRAELVREWGSPAGETAAPGRRLPHPTLLFYFDRDAAGGCIDSFLVERDERETIVAYVCR